MRRIYLALFTCMLVCIGCEWHLKSADGLSSEGIQVERYDRIEALYLTTGDRSAMQQMNTLYPEQTRMLIENVLRIGQVNDPMINAKFLNFFQDSVLQAIVNEVELQYADMSDLNQELTLAFRQLRRMMPGMSIPVIYAQIGALNQSIIVGDSTLGISLDKYLGADYALYSRFYPQGQRQQMERKMIVPDCLSFYILSRYPLSKSDTTPEMRKRHMGKIQWVVNKVTRKRTFSNDYVRAAETYMHQHPRATLQELLEHSDSITNDN